MTEAITTTLPHQVVRASAGAGKTYQLTTRYLQLLRRGEPMRNVLATTFTRKAAGEVLARVLGRLAQACREAAGREQLAQALGGPALSHTDCMSMLRTLTDGLGRLSVGTIDGFFNRAARAMALELGLPSNARLIDEGAPLARQMRTDAIHAVLGEQAASDDAMAALIEMLRRLHHDTAQRSVTEAIDAIVVQLDEAYRSYPERDLWDQLPTAGRLSPELLTTALHGLEAMRPDLPTTQKGGVNQAFKKAYDALLADAQLARWDAVLGNGLVGKVAQGEASYNRAAITEDWRSAIYPLFLHAKAVRIGALADQTRATYDLLALFDRHYEAMRYGQGVLLFSDLTYVLASGLPGMGDAGVEELCYRLDARVQHLLLDEFQDTSLAQWRVLRPFAEQAAAYGDGSRSLFVVGDTKQAIYNWRGGCAELFDEVESLPGVGRLTLSESWRSSPIVLGAVNRVFQSLATNAALDGCRDAADAWQRGYPTHIAARGHLPGHVVLRTTAGEADDRDGDADDDEADDQSAPPDAHAQSVASYIQDLNASMPGRSIGVLVRRRSAAFQLMHALRSLGVPAAEEGGNPIGNVPAVSAVLSAIQLADHPGDRVARFHVLNSPVAEVLGFDPADPTHDTDTTARRIRRLLLDQGYAAVIGDWARRLADSCDAASLRRLMQLVELAERFDEEDAGLRPSFFVEAARAAKVEDPAAALVRVMTIHAAKGLEFDAVVLPDLDSGLSKSDSRDLLVLDRDSPISTVRAVYRRADQATMRLLPELQRSVDQRTREKRTEDLCLLYVAMTRARHALHLLVRPLRQKTRKDAHGNPQPTGEPSATGLSNLSYAAVLRQSLRAVEQEGFTGNELLYEDGDAAWAGGALPDQPGAPNEPRPPRPIRLAKPVAGRGRSWLRTTPSSLHEDATVSAAELLRQTPSGGRAYGTLMHALFATVGFTDESPPDAASLDRILSSTADPSINPAQLRDTFNRSLVQPAIHQLLSRDGAAELWRERSFIARVDRRVVTGTFDRVHLWTEGTQATRALLIDYKTDRVDDTTVDAVAERYAEQLRLYRAALAVMTALDPSAIAARLCFVGDGRVVAID